MPSKEHHWRTPMNVSRWYIATPTTGNNLHHDKLILPRRKQAFDIPNTITEQPTDGNPKSIGRIPQTHSYRLLASCIPHARDEHEPGVCAGLCGSSQRSEDSKGGEIVACGLDHEEDAPAIDSQSIVVFCTKWVRSMCLPHENVYTKVLS